MSRPRSGRAGQSKRPAVAIIIEEPDWRTQPRVITTIRRAAGLALAAKSAYSRAHWNRASVSVLLTDDARLKQLNAAFRNQTKPTNVLSFPALPDLWPYAGDIAVAYGVLRRESAAQSKSLAAHAAHLTIHGILHLLGYDHERPDEAKVMENLEILLLGKLGIADPYAPVPIRRRPKRPKFRRCPKVPAR